MLAKHEPRLRSVIPFGDDPYDAVGSFACIVGMLVAVLSLVRAFRPYSKDSPTKAQCVYLVRSQEAVVLAVLLTLITDGVAMARHPSLWTAAESRRELIALLGGLAATLVVQWLIRSSRHRLLSIGSRRWGRVGAAGLLTMFVLAVYPEQLIQHTVTHLLTIVIGALILFAWMRVLLITLVPYKEDEELTGAMSHNTTGFARLHRWGMVILLGSSIGFLAFLAEISEGGAAMEPIRLFFVASVFVGLGLSGILVAYLFLATPLGLGSRS
jgi:hypothetical protein